MKEYIAFDSHKHYTLAEREDHRTCRTRQQRIEHSPGAIRGYLKTCPSGTDSGGGGRPQLVLDSR